MFFIITLLTLICYIFDSFFNCIVTYFVLDLTLNVLFSTLNVYHYYIFVTFFLHIICFWFVI